MMRYRRLAARLGLTILTVAALPSYAQAPAPGTPAQRPPAGAAAEMSRGDKNFLRDAQMSGIAAVEASKIVLAKSADPKLKEYAQRVVKDHGAVVAELAALASRKGLEPVSEPSMLQRTQLKALEALDGADLEKMYAKQFGVISQENNLMEFQNASTKAEDPEVRTYAKSRVSSFQDRANAGRSLGRMDHGL